MEFKINLNKIHYLLTERFEDVKVKECANSKLGAYVEFSVKENVECKFLIRKIDLEKSNITFLYSTNPLSEEGTLISRVSNIETIAESIKDIIDNKRFDSEYLNNLK
jgi:hypothetical protein